MGENYRQLFAYHPELIYFNHAATGNLPKRAATAMKAFIDKRAVFGEPPLEQMFDYFHQFRAEAGKLMNVDPNQISFIKNTSDGIALALFSIDWQPGDNMVVQEDAFPASLYQVHYCFPKIEKRYVALANGSAFYDRLSQAIDGRTRLIAIDFVHFLSGYRVDVSQLWQLTQHAQAYLLVDGIQGLGAVNVDLTRTPVDFFAAGGIKWLQGPFGTGIFYVRQEIMDKLIPFHISWSSAKYEDFSSFYPLRPLPDNALRFQPLNENYVGLIGLTECLKMFNEIGISQVEQQVLSLTDQALTGLSELDCEILTPPEKERRAGIVTFKHSKIESAVLHERLGKKLVKCSLREGWIRFALQFYNTKQEVEKALLFIGEEIQRA